MCLTLIVGLPILLFVTARKILKLRQAKDTQTFQDNQSYSSIVSKQMRDCAVGNYWRPIILVRWTITNIIIIFFRDYPEYQVVLLMSISVFFQSIMIFYKLIPNRLDFSINLFNELAASVYLYLMMMLTDFQGENPLRDDTGLALLALVSIVVTVNVIKTCFKAYPSLKQWVLLKTRKIPWRGNPTTTATVQIKPLLNFSISQSLDFDHTQNNITNNSHLGEYSSSNQNAQL